MNLYEIEKEYDALNEIMNSEDVLSIEQQQIIIEFLDGNSELLEKKLENYVKVIRNIESDEEKCKIEMDKLKKKKEILESKSEYLKSNIKNFMKKFKLKTQKAGIFNFTLKINPPALKITGIVPQKYYIPQPSIVNNAKIKEILLNNETTKEESEKIKIDFAELTRGESLQIK